MNSRYQPWDASEEAIAKTLDETALKTIRSMGVLPSEYAATRAAESAETFSGPRDLTAESVAARMGVLKTG